LGRSRLAAIVDTILGRGLVAADSDASSEEAAAVKIEGADAREDAIGRAEGNGVGGTAGSRGALLIGNG
jgi:type IV secretory pathway TrbL component